MLGVSPGTLRRWSDAGRLRVFTTPGGHRRFARTAVQGLMPSDRVARPSLESAGLTPDRLVRTYHRAAKKVVPDLPWVLELTPEQRLVFRERGHLLAAQLLAYLDATQPATAAHHLDEAIRTASEYGQVAAGLRLSLSQAVEGFLRFRAPFHGELAAAARRRGFDTAETTELLETAEHVMDQLLVATMSGHASTAKRPRASSAPPPPAYRPIR
jgi:excisionase family DNA binding protein